MNNIDPATRKKRGEKVEENGKNLQENIRKIIILL